MMKKAYKGQYVLAVRRLSYTTAKYKTKFYDNCRFGIADFCDKESRVKKVRFKDDNFLHPANEFSQIMLVPPEKLTLNPVAFLGNETYNDIAGAVAALKAIMEVHKQQNQAE